MSVHEKMLLAQRSVEAVVKRGTNEDQGYSYATASDVVAVCRKALHDAGLYPAIDFVETIERRILTEFGKGRIYVEVRATLTITDPEVDSDLSYNAQQSFTASGAGADYQAGDKAILKAQTAATKYVYANALALPFADHDPDQDAPQVDAARLPEREVDLETALSEAQVEELVLGLAQSKLGFKRLCVLMGAVDAERPRINRRDSIRKAFAALTENQAGTLRRQFEAERPKAESKDGAK